jgi:hypothetical protein
MNSEELWYRLTAMDLVNKPPKGARITVTVSRLYYNNTKKLPFFRFLSKILLALSPVL